MPRSFDTLLYQRQADLISGQRASIAALEAKLEQCGWGAHFYLALVDAIKDNLTLQAEWHRFISILRLANPDLPGLTNAERESQY